MSKLKINRAPVLTLWAVVVAERLGYKHEEALTIAKALTGLTAQSHGRALGIFHPTEKGKLKAEKPQSGKRIMLQFLARQIEVVKTKEGVRAVSPSNPKAWSDISTINSATRCPTRGKRWRCWRVLYRPKN